jgi:hypothetical protein
MNDKQFYLSGSEEMGYSVIDAKAGMPLCAPKPAIEDVLLFVMQWRLPLSSVMWDSDTLSWVNINPNDEESPQA